MIFIGIDPYNKLKLFQFLLNPSNHPLYRLILFRVTGKPGAYPREHRAQGRVHPGQGANPSQGTLTYTFTHPFIHYGHFGQANQTTVHMSLDWGRKPEYPEETPAARGEHANSAHTGPRWELKPPTLEM